MKKILPFLFLSPLVVSAHVKWFAQSGMEVRPYSLSDSWVISWIVIVLLVVIVGYILEKRLPVPEKVYDFGSKYGDVVHSICTIGIGLSLILFSLNSYVFAPNMVSGGDYVGALLFLQGLSGVMIFLGFYERVGAVILAFCYVLAVGTYGFVEMLDALDILGIAVYILIIGRPKWKLISHDLLESFGRKYHSFGVPSLRAFTGLNLVILGFSEKILNPSLTQSFLEHYHWNFMQALGFEWFSNYWFAFSAGVMESLIGLFFILGFVTRLTTLALAGFLVTTLILLGPVELIGHLPHFSIAIVFLVLGSGNRLKIYFAS